MKSKSTLLADEYPISVIVPCYNAAHTLRDCLSALAANELTNVEVIVVDDASTDGTKEVLSNLESLFRTGIRSVHLPEQSGPGAARNAGMRAAYHAYLLFLDADIVLPGKSVQWIRETLDLYSHQDKVIGALGTYADKIPVEGFFTAFKNLYTCYLYRVTDTFSPFIHTPMFAVEKAVLEREGIFDANMARAEDFKLGATLGAKGYRFIIDRRIKGTHLKTYTLFGILREDWHRIRELTSIQLTREQRKFSYKAHRWSRMISLLLPGLTILLAALGLYREYFLWLAGVLLILFILINSRFLLFLFRREGLSFAIRSALFLFIEMLWAQATLVFSAFRSKKA